MAGQKSNSKRQRSHKISAGINGATKHPLNPVERVLLNKGQMQTIKHVPCLRAWRGVGVVTEPFNPRQVTENRLLYPHLFMED